MVEIQEGNFLAKSVSTPTGTKMTFPSNVRIISVPTGSNIGVTSGGSAGASSQKITTSTGNVSTSQVKYTGYFCWNRTNSYFHLFRRTSTCWN